MHYTKVHPFINKIICAFYRIGYWNREHERSSIKQQLKWFYLIYHFMFPLLLIIGSLENGNKDERIFLVEAAIVNIVLSVKFFLMTWKQAQVVKLLEEICTFSVRDLGNFASINRKLNHFSNRTKLFVWVVIALAIFELCAPFAGERKLFFKIALPFDGEKNELNFLVANAYISSGIMFAFSFCLFSLILWYIMFNCSLRYQALGMDLVKIGRSREELKGIPDIQKQNAFREDLSKFIRDWLRTRELVGQLELLCSIIFFLEIGTSGLCICASIYCLAFDVSDRIVGGLVHLSSLVFNVAGIFISTYLGNEIMRGSDRLTYCLFELDWFDQPQSTKMTVVVLVEWLRKPHKIVVAKLYPLTLETFSKILNFAYMLFNVLKSFRM